MPKRSKDQRIRAAQDAAALDFKPWEESRWRPPLTDKEWLEFGRPHLIMLRLAWAALHRTKSQLMEFGSELALETSQDFEASWLALEAVGEILKTANMRILGAAAASTLDTTGRTG